ncbi:MAG: NAD(P)H-dependent oxidoreductase [Betaproteobacteria bacterium]
MPKLLIVYHSQTGGTASLVERAAYGANSIGETSVVVMRAGDALAADVIDADGLLLGTPENFGTMSGMLKDFFDRVFYGCENDLAGRPYSVLVCAGNDGTGAMREVDRIVTGWRMRKVHPGVIARRVGGMAGSSHGHLDPADLKSAEELGATLAAGLALGMF